MNILICIDDTDNLESQGTGHIAEILRHDLESIFKGKTTRITRHQLFVSDDIPYTSHNSAMCFTAEISGKDIDKVIEYSGNFLEQNSAPGSDPGLCVAVKEFLAETNELIGFGLDATKKVLTKNDAVELARRTDVHLSEHGGTGGGIIGALAGMGLRLYGNNGRFKGWVDINESHKIFTPEILCGNYDIQEVRSTDGTLINKNEKIMLNGKVKTVMLDNKSVLLVKRIGESRNLWENLAKEELRRY